MPTFCPIQRKWKSPPAFRVLDLETLIALKEELGRDKDRAVLDVLRRTLAEARALGKT